MVITNSKAQGTIEEFFGKKLQLKQGLQWTREALLHSVSKKSIAQGTIEYLVILAVIVIVGLIVVSLILQSTAPAQGISGTTSQIATASNALAVTESIVSQDGNYFLKIKNNTGENITITKIEIGDIIDATPNKPIPMNVEEAFILATDSLCSQGQLLAEEVTITYTN